MTYEGWQNAPRPLVWDATPRPRHVGLALGGGAARGLAHIGVLEVLTAYRIPIHLVTGCSVGALIACGRSPRRATPSARCWRRGCRRRGCTS